MWSRARWLIVAALIGGGLWWMFANRDPKSEANRPQELAQSDIVAEGEIPTATTRPEPSISPSSTGEPTSTVAPVPTDTPVPVKTPLPTGTAPPSETPAPSGSRDLEIVTLLPKDAIPAIFDPQFFSADEADQWYDPDELILGVEIDGDARAYSIPFLSRREIVNDTVGGRKIAVTW